MDPLAALSAAQEIAGLCLNLVKQIKKLVETIKGAKEAFIKLLSRLERMRLLLNEFKSLAQRLENSPQHLGITLAFDDSACGETVNRLQALVSKVDEEVEVHEYWMKVKWIGHKDEAAKLLARLANHESDLTSVLHFITAQSSITTEQEIQQLKAELNARSVVVDPFSDRAHPSDSQLTATSLETELRNNTAEESQNHSANIGSPMHGSAISPSRHWLSSRVTNGYDTEYALNRKTLARAAKYGKWVKMFDAIRLGQERYGEEWVNSFKPVPSEEVDSQSLWTPLHQAAYMGAPLEVVQALVNLGSFRTIRTRTSSHFFPYSDMTAFEIAASLGYAQLRAMLAPHVVHYLPAQTVTTLQERLHDLIKQLLGENIEKHCIRLPEVSVLTELEVPKLDMLFPRSATLGKISIYLDARELLLRYCPGREGSSEEESLYRISTDGSVEIESALSFQW